MIGVAAVRYFMVKYSRGKIIAFDLDEALSFEGESGPYLQYAAVRANNIFRRVEAENPNFSADQMEVLSECDKVAGFLDESEEVWDMVYAAARLDETADLVVSTLEPATLAK